ncbi:MAG: hypothetical protein N2167_04140 [Flavobacteriales bacterium]|nr:hypothetical protein [Flavobacteriales bacterium]
MRNFIVFLLIALLFGIITSCKKEDVEGTPVVLTANIDQLSTGAAKVVAISLRSGNRLIDITNNQFSVTLDNGQPWTLVFLTANNQPLGHIKLSGTIESLPMYYVPTDINTINLGTLNKDGFVFTPNIDILQTTIPLNGTEQLAVGQTDDWFAASANNLDVDGNGTLDFLQNNDYGIGVLYFINGGVFASGTTPSLDTSGFVNGFKLIVHIEEASLPSAIYITGPVGSGLQNALATEQNNYGDYIDFFSPMVQSQFPPGGEYQVTYNSKTLTFSIPDQSYILNNIVIPWPTVHLNNNGTINNISWQMKLPFINNTINPLSLVRKVQVQIDGTGPTCQTNMQGNRLYNSPDLSAEITTHILECQNIEWNNVQKIYMTYWDQYDQHYVVTFNR